MSGYITYIEYQAGSTKGSVTTGDMFNNPFKLGDVDSTYTSQKVVEPVDSFVSGTTKIAWTPVAVDENNAPIIRFLDADGNELTATNVSVAADGTVTATIASGTVKKIAYE